MTILPCRLAGPFRGLVPCAELEQRTVQLYRCSPHSKDTDLEHTVHLRSWNPFAGYHCKGHICLNICCEESVDKIHPSCWKATKTDSVYIF